MPSYVVTAHLYSRIPGSNKTTLTLVNISRTPTHKLITAHLMCTVTTSPYRTLRTVRIYLQYCSLDDPKCLWAWYWGTTKGHTPKSCFLAALWSERRSAGGVNLRGVASCLVVDDAPQQNTTFLLLLLAAICRSDDSLERHST